MPRSPPSSQPLAVEVEPASSSLVEAFVHPQKHLHSTCGLDVLQSSGLAVFSYVISLQYLHCTFWHFEVVHIVRRIQTRNFVCWQA